MLDIYQLNVISEAAGQIGENVFHYLQQSGSTSTNPGATAESLILSWISHVQNYYIPLLPSDATLIGYKCKRLNNGGGPTAMNPTNVSGTGGGTCSVTVAGACLIWPYTNGTRYFAGRTFIPFGFDGAWANNEPDPSFSSDLNTFITQITTALVVTAINYLLEIYSRKLKTTFQIQGPGISIKPGVQRKRALPIM